MQWISSLPAWPEFEIIFFYRKLNIIDNEQYSKPATPLHSRMMMYLQWDHWRRIKRWSFRHSAAQGPTLELCGCRYNIHIYIYISIYFTFTCYIFMNFTHIYIDQTKSSSYISFGKILSYILYSPIHKATFRKPSLPSTLRQL